MEGLCLANESLENISSTFTPEKMKKMRKLRILIIKNCDIRCIEYLCTELLHKQLRWVFLLECTLQKLPSFSKSQMMTVYMAHACSQVTNLDDFDCKVSRTK